MFRITRKADYAVFILSYLARRTAKLGEETLVSAQELASFSNLNKSLVANLLKDLTRSGFLGSVRGARGGYRLARRPDEISLSEILQAVEGPFTFVECAQESGLRGDDAAWPPRRAAAPDDPAATPDDPDAGSLATDHGPGGRVPDHESCSLTGMCQSQGPLLVLHMRIRGMLEDLKLSELAGVSTFPPKRSAASTPARAAAGAHRPISQPAAEDLCR